MVQKLVLRKETIKVKGRVKAITIKKEDFDKFLKLTKLRILDKSYEALMPPIENLMKNTIDVNGLTQLVQSYLTLLLTDSGGSSSVTPAQMVLTTSTGTNITLSYASSISLNSQGVAIFVQLLEQNGNYTLQFYYVGFDTTNNSYATTQAELYVSAGVNVTPAYSSPVLIYTPLVRLALSSIGLSKSPNEYLFLVWLIEFENIPPYLLPFTPFLKNPLGLYPFGNGFYSSGATIYFSNGNCNFTCGGNCPSSGLNGFITYIQNNTVVVEFPLQAPLGKGVTQLQVLFCVTWDYGFVSNGYTTYIDGYTSTTLTPNVQGATFYVAIATITITYQVS